MNSPDVRDLEAATFWDKLAWTTFPDSYCSSSDILGGGVFPNLHSWKQAWENIRFAEIFFPQEKFYQKLSDLVDLLEYRVKSSPSSGLMNMEELEES